MGNRLGLSNKRLGESCLILAAVVEAAWLGFFGGWVAGRGSGLDNSFVQQKVTSHNNDSFFGYKSREELMGRSQRFPSVDDRVRAYMSNWYAPPCDDNEQGFVMYKKAVPDESGVPEFLVTEVLFNLSEKPRTFLIRNKYEPLAVFNMNSQILADSPKKNIYEADYFRYAYPSFEFANFSDGKPNLVEFGDAEPSRAYVPSIDKTQMYPGLPFIKKFRRSISKSGIDDITSKKCVANVRPSPHSQLQPIIWLLTYGRHYGMLRQVVSNDIPWTKKRSIAVFRGAHTGCIQDVPSTIQPREMCMLFPRCKLVYNHLNSKLVDARMVDYRINSGSRVPAETFKLYGSLLKNGIDLSGGSMTMGELLQYKALIMLQGNDVSTGFKWALLSNSVVMTQIPTLTSWALEDQLEPWVHYVPLNENLTDVEEKMQWVIDNDAEAQEIARRGSLWIMDLIFHPDEMNDRKKIFNEMALRYSKHFRQHLPIPSAATDPPATDSPATEPPTPTPTDQTPVELGCWADDASNRALPYQAASASGGNPHTGTTIEKCWALCLDPEVPGGPYLYSGSQSKGECWCGSDPPNEGYAKHGTARDCNCEDPTGSYGSHVQCVYQLTASGDPTPTALTPTTDPPPPSQKTTGTGGKKSSSR